MGKIQICQKIKVSVSRNPLRVAVATGRIRTSATRSQGGYSSQWAKPVVIQEKEVMTGKMCKVQKKLNNLLKTGQKAVLSLKSLQNCNKLAEILTKQNSQVKRGEEAEVEWWEGGC